MTKFEYDDDYHTCAETFSTLRIYSDTVNPSEITRTLGITPTKSWCRHELFGNRSPYRRKANGWFYTTERSISSRDTRRHIDLIIEALKDAEVPLEILRQKGCKMDISSYWVGIGHGGPSLWPHQMLRLGALGLMVWWDVYFNHENEDASGTGDFPETEV